MNTEALAPRVSSTPHPSALARRMATPVAPSSDAPKFFKLADLKALPPAQWLKEGILPVGLSRLYGPPKIGKTFLALDWACGLAAEGQPVVYVMGEGKPGILKRLEAWQTEHSLTENTLDQLDITDGPVNMLSPSAVTAFILRIGETRPALIVLDTLARCFGGGNENEASDMGRFVRHCDLLRERLGCSVLVLHHTGKDPSKGGRGSSAFLGAADCDMELSGQGNELCLTNPAMKDFKKFEPIVIELAPVDDSLVIRYTGRPGPSRVKWPEMPNERRESSIPQAKLMEPGKK